MLRTSYMSLSWEGRSFERSGIAPLVRSGPGCFGAMCGASLKMPWSMTDPACQSEEGCKKRKNSGDREEERPEDYLHLPLTSPETPPSQRAGRIRNQYNPPRNTGLEYFIFP
jgi:hypothetical protein